MYKLIRITIFLISTLTYSQIDIKISPIENHNSSKYLKIDIYNNSNDYYAIPLDTLNLRPFDNDFKWKKFDKADVVQGSLAMTLYIKEKNDNDYLTAVFKSPDIDGEKLDQIEQQLSYETNLRNNQLEKWRKKIKSIMV
ncbi:hypothetical protein ACFQO9_09420 [Chryseobacterium zhengzhouense]|uniref:Uncharacterized protein n=1 Tax=Chryseobacterium zhengzhouense TaxID=1636086 RepID=A0ABW2LXK5_9FLAO